jgi:hypothetical protein
MADAPTNSGPAPSQGNAQSGGEALSETEISALFRHDPLSSEPVTPERLDAADPGGSQQAAPPVQTPAPPAQTPPVQGGTPQQTQGQPQGEPPVDPLQEIAILRARLEALTSGGDQGQGTQPPAQQGQQGQQPNQPTEQDPLGLGAVPQYMYQVPPQVAQALAHEDPNIRSQALSAWTAASLQQVHQQMRNEVAKVVGNLRNEIPQVIQAMTQYQQATQSIFQDFYGTYKELDKTEFRPVVMQIAQKLKDERPDLAQGGWNARFRDELAARVAKTLNVQLPARQGQQQPPKMSSTTSRPGPQNLNGQAKHIGDMFD